MFEVSSPLRKLRAELASFVWRSPLAGLADEYRTARELRGWIRGTGQGAAPTLIKRALLRSLAAAYRLGTFVETGTCLATTTYALRNDFDRIITIELDPALCANARRRLARQKHIQVLQGDSASVLPQVLAELDGPALFFLDGHYSGGITARGDKDTPISEELASVLGHSYPHVVVIDDARCFNGENDYPTIDDLRAFVAERAPGASFSRHTDMVVVAPGPAAPIGLAT